MESVALAWVAIGVALLSPFGSLVLYNVKSNRKKGRDDVRLDKIEKDVNDHMRDDEPHKLCAKHTVMLENMQTTLCSMDRKLDTLDQRIYDKIQNGKVKIVEIVPKV